MNILEFCLVKIEHYNCLLSQILLTGVCVSLSHVPLSADPMDYSPPGSSVHRILQASILEWVAIFYSKLWLFFLLLSCC